MAPSLENAVINHSNADSEITSDDMIKVTRHFHPSVWKGYDFNLASTDFIDEERRQELKKEVKSMLSLVANDSFEELDLIDKIQRLGVAYHFEDEIEDILQRTYNEDYCQFFDQNGLNNENSDLCYVSLRFRLLRQAGFYVSPVVFKKFKVEKKSEFHANLVSDVQGMLSLYEASYLGFHGEDIMDDAMAFTNKHLKSMLTSLSTSLRLQVQHSLTMPPQRSVERIIARNYISVYQQDMSRNKVLLEFAKLDYNAVQLLHRKEISEVQSWWERMNVRSKLQYDVRDRVVEAYAITNNIYFEPQFSQGRIHLGKLWSILTVLDDSYDVYGNLEELGPLCDAFQR
ncbi:Terpene synthase [Thalictrum thalictroides]|uniref:Terpene synthase n=1 Tax=Thalictrum thalictroides TaxID=46969 RepID=A0A7J6V0F1_THATH|nr:Terpene synthase [Thalictrum thalictroides]